MTGPRILDIERLRRLLGTERDPRGRAFAPLADALRAAGRLEEAVEVVRAGTAAHPEFVGGHLVAGWVFGEVGNPKASSEHMDRVLQLDPDNARALEALASMAEETGDLDRASRLFRRLVQAEPWNAAAQEALARVETRASVPVQVAPSEGEAGTDGASSGEPAGRPEAPSERPDRRPSSSPVTRDAGDAGVEVTTEHDELLTRTMGELLVRQGMFDRAVSVYQRLAEREPRDARLQERLEEVRQMADLPSQGASSDAREPSVAPRIAASPPEPETEPTIGEYFDALFEGAATAEALAGDAVEDRAVAGATETPIPIAALGPDAVAVETLAPEIVPIQSLAPRIVGIETLAPAGGSAPAPEPPSALEDGGHGEPSSEESGV